MNRDLELSQRRINYILLGIILIGTGLRLYKIDFQSLWFDELHSVVPAAPESSLSTIVEYCKSDQPPAFFIYLHYFFKFFGYNEIVGRLASALLGIISIPVCYWLMREFSGKAASLMAALLVAVNYFHVYYSQELRFYTMLFLFSALSYLFFIRAFKTLRIWDFVGYTLATIGLLYTHYYGIAVFIIQALTFLVLVIFFKREVRFIAFGGLSGALVIVGFIPWIPVIINDLGISSFWIKKPSAIFLLDYFYNYTGKDVVTTLAWVTLMVFFIKTWKQVDESRRPLLVILLTWLVLSYLIPYLRSIISVPMLHIRYTMIALPAWIVIFAMGWDSIRKWRLKYYFVILIPLAAINSLSNHSY